MAWTKGLNFRITAGFVSDAASDTYCLATDTAPIDGENYPVTRNGVTFGYTSNFVLEARDRASGNNPKLAGFHYMASAGDVANVRVDLPAVGDYRVRMALGDANYSQTGCNAYVYDTSTLRLTVSGNTGAANSFLDATSTALTHNNWVSGNTPVTCTFASTIANIQLSNGITNTVVLAHVEFDQVEVTGLTHYVRMTA